MLAPNSRGSRRLLAPVLCLLLLGFVRPPCASADWGSGARVAFGGSYAADNPQLLRTTPTDILVTWRANSGLATQYHVQRMTSWGAVANGWPSNGVKVNATGLADYGTCWALDGTGGAYDAFSYNDGGTNYGVVFESVRGDGTNDPGLGYVWLATNKSFDPPCIAGDGVGGAYIGWVVARNSVYLGRFQSNGALQPGWPSAGLRLAQGALSVTAPPAITGDGAGGVYLFWMTDNSARAVRVNADHTLSDYWTSDGLPLGDPPPNGWLVTQAAILPSASGIMAAWLERPISGTGGRVALQRFFSDGSTDGTWPPSGLVVLDQSAPIGSVQFLPDSSDGVTVLWEQSGQPLALHVLSDGTLAPGYSAAGNSPLDAAAQYPAGSGFAAAARPGGGFTFAWSDARPSQPGVRVRWLRGDGTSDPAQPDTGRVASGPATGVLVRGLVGDGSDGVYVAWQQDSGPGPGYGVNLMMNRLVRTTLGVDRPPAARATFALRAPAPNPARGDLAVRFTLAGEAPARLELIDLAGRRVSSRSVVGAGDHLERFDRLGDLAPGVYLLRLTQGARSASTRVALIH